MLILSDFQVTALFSFPHASVDDQRRNQMIRSGPKETRHELPIIYKLIP